MTALYDIEVASIDGRRETLAGYRDKALLVVNVASKCGFTPQYAGLEALHRQFADLGFAVLGFPCNQFGSQEPGAEAEIAAFCKERYGVTFPMFAKIKVNGEAAHPLFRYLKRCAPGAFGTQAIKWNFTKFLVDRDGRVVKRYGPAETPETIGKDVEALL